MQAAPRPLSVLAAVWIALLPVAAAADDAAGPKQIFDTVLESLQFKAKPADPAPEFVRKTRPDAAALDYIQRPLPHKVSPIPTKSAAEVQDMKDALDQAHARQLNPVVPPVQIVTPKAPTRQPSPGKP